MSRDTWRVIGRGQAGWHAAAVGCSSSGGTLEGYAREAAEGAPVYDASEADTGAYVRHVMAGPMLSVELGPEGCDLFNQADREAAARMLPGLGGGFAVAASRAIVEPPADLVAERFSSLDKVGWAIYRRLLEKVGGVRFGVVRSGKVEWEAPAACFEAFALWVDVLSWVGHELPLYYQGPLDARPLLVAVERTSPRKRKRGRVKLGDCLLITPSTDCDPFIADESHLDRFRRLNTDRPITTGGI